ncbi:MAG TPA: HAMP domain-containing sensor histidine kinase [Acidobacteriaceae bacterium]|nr:HAMP domain-containing sensor histidine kinase [Acidobacteriaceae bacterium]
MRHTSLSRQLIVGILLAELACVLLFAGVAILHEMHGRQRAFDVMLRGRADSMLGAIHDAEDTQDNVYVYSSELVLPKHDLWEVRTPAGHILGTSPGASPAAMTALGSMRTDGYVNLHVNGEGYRGIRYDGVRVIDRDEIPGGLRRPVTIFYASPTRDLWREALEAVRFYVLAGGLLLALTGIALIWFLRRRLAPLQELADVASHVSVRSWDFKPPATALQTAELAPIARSIDELLDGLHQAFERQRQLTGDAAHELKTSIAVLKSSLQLLSMNPRTPEQYQTGLDTLLTDTERMEQLAARMLALARLEEAPAEEGASADLALALRNVAARLSPIAEHKQITLEVGAGSPLVVALSSDDAETLCSNLIINALQHAAPSGQVTASLDRNVQIVTLTVVDDGEGIPPEALPHVFERFYRADRSRSRLSGGAGLGLSICKAIVERAGGTIQIASTLGAGTRVTASLAITLNSDDLREEKPEMRETVESFDPR